MKEDENRFFFQQIKRVFKAKKIQVKQPVLKNKNLFNFLNLKNIFWVLLRAYR